VAQTKRIELVLAERYRREAQLAHFIRTSGRAPPLHWLPAKHSEETLQLLQKEQGRLEAWKVRGSCCPEPGQQALMEPWQRLWSASCDGPRQASLLRDYVRTGQLIPWSWQHNDSVALQADEVAKLEAEKERILQRVPGTAKPVANGAEDKVADGQTADGTEGKRMWPCGRQCTSVRPCAWMSLRYHWSRNIRVRALQRLRAMLPLKMMPWKAAMTRSTAKQRRKRPASAGNPAHGPMTRKLQGTPLPQPTSTIAGAWRWATP